MRVLVAFDKFKDSLSAGAACELAAAAILDPHPDWTVDRAPLTDGGDGFAELLTARAGGVLRPVRATGPRGADITAAIGWVTWRQVPMAARRLLGLEQMADSDAVAVIEMAAASGLARLAPAERDVWRTSTLGTGELVRAAGEGGARAIVLGVGGSATNDLGLGALTALGLEFRDAAGCRLDPPIPARWPEMMHMTGAFSSRLPPLRIACDVANPLLGSEGAATVFGRQKGLAPADLPRLEREATRVARMLCEHCGRAVALSDLPGAGAAGGLAFGLVAAGGARLVPGFALVRAWFELDERIAAADLVLTGEGRFDASSFSGKGPGALAIAARAAGKRSVVLAGALGEAPTDGWPAGIECRAIAPPELPLERALREAPDRLAEAVRKLVEVGVDRRG